VLVTLFLAFYSIIKSSDQFNRPIALKFLKTDQLKGVIGAPSCLALFRKTAMMGRQKAIWVLKNGFSDRYPALRGFCKCSHISQNAARFG
jgi:hypothetical protein